MKKWMILGLLGLILGSTESWGDSFSPQATKTSLKQKLSNAGRKGKEQLSKLRANVVYHGGRFSQGMRRKATHLKESKVGQFTAKQAGRVGSSVKGTAQKFNAKVDQQVQRFKATSAGQYISGKAQASKKKVQQMAQHFRKPQGTVKPIRFSELSDPIQQQEDQQEAAAAEKVRVAAQQNAYRQDLQYRVNKQKTVQNKQDSEKRAQGIRWQKNYDQNFADQKRKSTFRQKQSNFFKRALQEQFEQELYKAIENKDRTGATLDKLYELAEKTSEPEKSRSRVKAHLDAQRGWF